MSSRSSPIPFDGNQDSAERTIRAIAAAAGALSVPVVVLSDSQLLGQTHPITHQIQLGQRWVQAAPRARDALLAHEFAHTLEPRRTLWISLLTALAVPIPLMISLGTLNAGTYQRVEIGFTISAVGALGSLAIAGFWVLRSRRLELRADADAARWGFSFSEAGAREWALAQPEPGRFARHFGTHPTWKTRVASVERLSG